MENFQKESFWKSEAERYRKEVDQLLKHSRDQFQSVEILGGQYLSTTWSDLKTAFLQGDLRTIVSRMRGVDEETLKQIAQRTGGRYFRADSTATLGNIYADIDRLEKTEVEVKKYQRYRELFMWVALPGLVLLLLEIILSNTVWRKLP